MGGLVTGAELVDEAGRRRFRLIRKLGAGGFAEVWLASVSSPSGLERRVALKLLHGLAGEGDALQAAERLRDEARVLASLHHPVILDAHDLVQLGERIALVMEYVDGEDLGATIRHPTDPIPLGPLLEVAGHVASALDAAWRSLGLVHRDVKPSNIRIGRYGDVKLLDFGIARSDLMMRAAQTSLGILGSPGYLAPERFVPERPPHPGSDVFSLGCVLFEGTTRKPLFRGLDMAMVYGLSASKEKFQAFVARRLEEEVPERVGELLVRALAHDPDARPDAGAFAQQCDAALASLGEPSALRSWCRRHAWPNPKPEAETGRSAAPDPKSAAPDLKGATPVPAPEPRKVPAPLEAPTTLSGTNELSLAPPEPPAARSEPPAARGRPGLFMVIFGLGLALPAAAALVLLVAAALLGYLARQQAATAPEQPLPVLSLPGRPREAPPGDLAQPVPVTAPAPEDKPEPPVLDAPEPPPAEIERGAPREPSPEGPSSTPAPGGQPRTALVQVVGPPGEILVDGQKLGETNVGYRLALGAHTCRFLGQGAEPLDFPCKIEATSKTLIVPSVAVEVRGDVPVQLRNAGRIFDPRQVSIGETYEVFADFGRGWQEAGQIKVISGQHVLRCNAVREMCTTSR